MRRFRTTHSTSTGGVTSSAGPMISSSRKRRYFQAIAFCATGAVLLAACSSAKSASASSSSTSTRSTGPTSSATTASGTSLHALLPSAIRSAGVITVAAYPGFPPNNFLGPNKSTVIGVDPSLGALLGRELGVKWQIDKVSSFAGIIPGILSGRYDVGMSGITDTKAREKTLTFVDYLKVGSSILVHGGNPDHISDLADLCGKHVALASGTIGVQLATKQSSACTAAGKSVVTITEFPSSTQAELQVEDGRAAATIIDYTVASYIAAHSKGVLQVVGKPINPQPYGIAVAKSQTKLVTALQKAVQGLIDDGAYAKVLAQWHVSSAAIATATVDGAVS